MNLRTRSLRPLALPLLLAACVPGSLKLGEDTDPGTDTSGSDTSGAESDTLEPTTGEPEPAGVVEWTRKYDDIVGLDMAVTGDGTIVVVGLSGYLFSSGDGSEYANAWVGKFDPAGEPLWANETPLETSSPTAVAVDADGVIHVLTVDYSVLAGGGNSVRRLDPDGVELGVTTLPARPSSIAATVDGVIVGGAQSTGENSGFAWVTALDAQGMSLWERNFGDPQMRWSVVSAIAVDGDEVVLAGSLGVDPNSSQSQAWLLRAALADGATVWEQTLGPALATDTIFDVGLADDGTIVVLGRSDAPFVRALSAAGEELWTHVPGEVQGDSIGVGGDGSFALVGGLYLPPDDPNACMAGIGACPVALLADRHEADRSLRWSATRDECRVGTHVAVLPDDRVLVLAGCDAKPLSESTMGLMLFAP